MQKVQTQPWPSNKDSICMVVATRIVGAAASSADIQVAWGCMSGYRSGFLLDHGMPANLLHAYQLESYGV